MELLLLLLFCAGLLTNSGRYRVPAAAKGDNPTSLLAKLPFYVAAVVVGFLIFAVVTALLNA
ncbi:MULTISPECIES: hypothetical protein [Neisseria]|uniref:Uncharacterized protein n=1 Tax=Neisseria zoodegmatis TaxID=326523 RepID=A0AB38DNK2_9NEIS|nr:MULTISPECIES: hypothetical protein [Neisseria]OSI09271.1 hypothetical protein BWD10_10085 [Neisseria zoodegmatis]SNU78696.1 Uncharacterised protein [Neisseria zoodegmatis]